MFIEFFYLLRFRKVKVSIDEWLMLLDAMDKGLVEPSLKSFYNLCRNVLIKNEADYDAFDMVFVEFFSAIENAEDLPEEFYKWLSEGVKVRDINDKDTSESIIFEFEELLRQLKERIQEQKGKHDGGNYWIGTGGASPMGHSGYHPQGIRVGGESRHKSAVQIAGERHFKDFREDAVLDTRSFQMAFRKLRQYSSRVNTAETELDLEATIKETGDNAGNLKIVMKKPRKNTVKLLLLFDSDGSMLYYSRLSNQLFQAVSKSSHFKDLKVYYFHNCIYDHLYTTPYCRRGEWVETEWLMRTLPSDYKLIFVGDGTMAPSELFRRGGNVELGLFNEELGIDWLKKIKNRYEKAIWLNPIDQRRWDTIYGAYTLNAIRDVFPMYQLTVDGLEQGIKKLLVR